MVQTKPRLAIVGCGAVVDYHLLPSLRRIGWSPSVLVDRTPDRLQVAARKMGSKGKSVATASDWTSVVDAFDAAIVAVPHALHGPLGTALLNAGKHVFMEKPLATSGDECRAMIAAARSNGVTLSVGLLRRYLAVARWTKALLDAGVLGAIQRFDVREGFVFNWATSSDALIRPEMAKGGVLMDTGAHTLDLVLWWLGDAVVRSYRDDSARGVEADCEIDIETSSGARGRIELSRSRDLRNTIRIEGTRGFVEVHLSKNIVVAGSPSVLAFKAGESGADNFPLQLFPALFDAELTDFCASVQSGSHTGIPGAEGLRSVEMIEQCYRVREPLKLPWVEPRPQHRIDGSSPRPTIAAGSTVVVTGATGFIGGALVERLVHDCGAKVRCVVREIGHAMRLARLPVEVVRADLADSDAVSRAIEGADYVFHCAYDPRSRSQNVEGTRNLIEASLAHRVRRFVFISTFSVYEPFPDGALSEETRNGDPSWVYVRTKLELEKIVFDATKTRGLPGTVVQPTIVYGPFSKPWTNAPAEMLIFGDVILPDRGQGICNAVYIDDLVDGLILAAERPAAIGERFILSGPEPVTWARFFDSFARVLKVSPPIFWPAERISKSNHGLMRDVRMVLSNPKRLVQIIVRWPAARQALQAGLDSMPTAIRDLVDKYYFAQDGRRVGEVFLPDRQALALYAAKATVDSAKARRLLGYKPQYDFEGGMEPTKRYLTWAYGDIAAAVVRPSASPPSQTTDAPVKRAHAG